MGYLLLPARGDGADSRSNHRPDQGGVAPEHWEADPVWCDCQGRRDRHTAEQLLDELSLRAVIAKTPATRISTTALILVRVLQAHSHIPCRYACLI